MAGPGRRGFPFTGERQYQTLLHASTALGRLRDELNGVARFGRGRREVQAPTPDRAAAIPQQQGEVARRALGQLQSVR